MNDDPMNDAYNEGRDEQQKKCAADIRKTAKELRESGEGPYGSDHARRLRQSLGAMDADPGFAAMLNVAYIRGVNDAAKICEGKLLDDREPVGGTDAE